MIRLIPQPRRYAWGSPTAIPQLVGSQPDGEPLAELWFGAHPDAPCDTEFGRLDAVLAAGPELLGAALGSGPGGGRLPFMLKLLAAHTPLSLQVHPSAEQAAAGYADEESRGVPRDALDRRYRDPFGKPELIHALTPFEALCSFRPAARCAELLGLLDVAELAPTLDALAGPRGIRRAMSDLFALPEGDRRRLATSVTAACQRLADQPEVSVASWRDTLAAAVRVGEHHPCDVGIVVALMLNYIRLEPGQSLFMGAGQIHAYLSGTAVEVLGASDNVLRCGLTPKFVDVDELLRIADLAPGEPPTYRGPVITPPVPDFSVRRLGPGETAVAPPGQPVLILALHGDATIGGEELGAGTAALLTATDSERDVSSSATTFLVMPNLT